MEYLITEINFYTIEAGNKDDALDKFFNEDVKPIDGKLYAKQSMRED